MNELLESFRKMLGLDSDAPARDMAGGSMTDEDILREKMRIKQRQMKKDAWEEEEKGTLLGEAVGNPEGANRAFAVANKPAPIAPALQLPKLLDTRIQQKQQRQALATTLAELIGI